MEPARIIPDVACDQMAMDLEDYLEHHTGNPTDLAQRLAWAMITQARIEQAEKIILKCTLQESEILFLIDGKEYGILPLIGYDSNFIKMVMATFKKEGFNWESGNQGEVWIFTVKIA